MIVMDDETLEKIKKAGKIAAEALAYGKSLVKPGVLVVSVCDKIDEKIALLGGQPAFPAQISMNDVAAHFCPTDEDKTVFKEQIVKIDVGVHFDGFIGDTAATVDLSGKYSELIKASEIALHKALEIVKPGVTLAEIGGIIHEVITSHGFSPIRNLSGHALGEYNIHMAPSIPNFNTGDKTQLEEDMLIAIEPFATNGAGVIYESSNATIFSVINKKPVRNLMTRNVLKELDKLNGLPFTIRWLTRKFPTGKVNFALREMKQLGIIRDYPPLIDQKHGMVSQAEHTVLVRDKPIITTSID